MSKKKTAKRPKLAVKKETLRSLGGDKLTAANGGLVPGTGMCPTQPPATGYCRR